jgi:hypothetical protein
MFICLLFSRGNFGMAWISVVAWTCRKAAMLVLLILVRFEDALSLLLKIEVTGGSY